jgi:hypothetical protein
MDFGVGLIYEDCAFHPVLCTSLSVEDDEMRGISLIDGSTPRSCSPRHCGPVPLTVAEAVWIKEHFETYARRRAAFEEPSEIIPAERAQPPAPH